MKFEEMSKEEQFNWLTANVDWFEGAYKNIQAHANDSQGGGFSGSYAYYMAYLLADRAGLVKDWRTLTERKVKTRINKVDREIERLESLKKSRGALVSRLERSMKAKEEVELFKQFVKKVEELT